MKFYRESDALLSSIGKVETMKEYFEFCYWSKVDGCIDDDIDYGRMMEICDLLLDELHKELDEALKSERR